MPSKRTEGTASKLMAWSEFLSDFTRDERHCHRISFARADVSLTIDFKRELRFQQSTDVTGVRQLEKIFALATHGLEEKVATRAEQIEITAPVLRHEMNDNQGPKAGSRKWQPGDIKIAGDQ